LAAAAAAGAAVLLATQLGGGVVSPAQAQAARVLAVAGRAAARQPARLPGPRQFFFVRQRSTVLLPIKRDATAPLSVTEKWGPHALVTIATWDAWSTRRRGATATRLVHVTFPTLAARRRWISLGRPRLYPGLISSTKPIAISEVPRIDLGRGHLSLTLRALLALPPKPARLYGRIFAGDSGSDALDTLSAVDVYPIRPRLRGALYRAAARVRGIVVEGRARCLTGRSGVVLSARDSDGAVADQVIIDPSTGALLGSRSVTIVARANGLPLGTVRAQSAVVQRAVVNTPRPPRRRH
jgi:hypothetical protein